MVRNRTADAIMRVIYRLHGRSDFRDFFGSISELGPYQRPNNLIYSSSKCENFAKNFNYNITSWLSAFSDSFDMIRYLGGHYTTLSLFSQTYDAKHCICYSSYCRLSIFYYGVCFTLEFLLPPVEDKISGKTYATVKITKIGMKDAKSYAEPFITISLRG